MERFPTPYPEANDVLDALSREVRQILQDRLIGIYLEGSLANGDFNANSDVDFIVVTESPITDDLFAALFRMHERIAAIDSPWAIELEGSYLSRHALRRHDPAQTLHPNLERGRGERLKWAKHDQGWDTHRWIMRERGITLAGPPPHTLIHPVSPDQLRRGMRAVLGGWGTWLLDDPTPLNSWGYQGYAVHTLSRVLYTLAHGAVVSKPTASRWAREHLEERWARLVERAWTEGREIGPETSPEEVSETLAFLRWVREEQEGPA